MSPLVPAIVPADLLVVQQARYRAELAAKDLEVVNLKLALRYHLVEGDTYDTATGKITRAKPPAVEEALDSRRDPPEAPPPES
jgi:hypothetical protein